MTAAIFPRKIRQLPGLLGRNVADGTRNRDGSITGLALPVDVRFQPGRQAVGRLSCELSTGLERVLLISGGGRQIRCPPRIRR